MIKQTAHQMHFGRKREEIEIAKSLEEGFDVNFAQSYSRNNIECSYYFLGATKLFKERFGLDMEILCIYDYHTKPDARIFSAIRDLLNQYYTRLNHSVVLVIIEGKISEIKEMIDATKEIAFIAIQKEELLKKNRYDPYYLRKKFSNVLGNLDLFGISSPLKTDTYLYGRDDIIAQLMNMIVLKKGNSGIFGLRKTGKTSVLFALERRFDKQNIISVYIDCHKNIYQRRWWKFLEYVASRIVEKVENLNLFQNDNLNRYSNSYNTENCLEKFEALATKLLRNTKQIVILFDEIEYITPRIASLDASHWDQDSVQLWQIMRGLHQENNGNFNFVLAGVNPYILENPYIDNKQNPIFQMIQPIYLNPLDKNTLREMVRSIGKYLGMKFDEDVYSYLLETFGGHAFLTRLACSELYQNYKSNIDYEGKRFFISDFERIRESIFARLKNPCMEIILSLIWWYSEEYELVSFVADKELEFVKEYIENVSINYFHLINYGLLCKDTYDFKIRILRDFLKKYSTEWEKTISPFKRSGFTEDLLPDEANLKTLSGIYEKRSQIEQLLRRVIFLYISISCAFDNQKIAKKIIDSLTNKNVKDLFIGREPKDVMNELYFSDLTTLMKNNWDQFSSLFDNQKERFSMNMEVLSKYRNTEAHVKPIKDEDIVNFNNSFSWIHFYLKKVNV